MPNSNTDRADKALEIRTAQAKLQRSLPLPGHANNGDEDTLAARAGCYSKGLPHDKLGHVNAAAYDAMLLAMDTHEPDDFEAIPMGETDLSKRRKLVNPQAGVAFEMLGADSHHMVLPPPPRFDSPEIAGEIVENYWMALTRDIPFGTYEAAVTPPMIREAVDDLNKLTDFRGPKIAGKVTPRTLFRGFTPGDLTGPYVSQFLLRAVKFGSDIFEQRIQTTQPGLDFMTKYDDWLTVQRGTSQPPNAFDPVARYVRNGRDAGQYVHIDVLFQAYFDACLIIAAPVVPGNPLQSGFGAPLNPATRTPTRTIRTASPASAPRTSRGSSARSQSAR